MLRITFCILTKIVNLSLNFRLEQNGSKIVMGTWNEYLKGLLQKIMKSHSVLSELKDNPGDLEIINRELLRITGFFNVVVAKLESENFQSKDISDLKPKLKNYLNTYYFEKEIETMAPLYSDDPNRIKNLRLKILESLEDKKLMDRIQDAIDDL